MEKSELLVLAATKDLFLATVAVAGRTLYFVKGKKGFLHNDGQSMDSGETYEFLMNYRRFWGQS